MSPLPRRRGSTTFTALGATIALWVFAGCTYPATQILVEIDTDLPASREILISATIYFENPRDVQAHRWLREVGNGLDGGIRLPATFGIVPGNRPRDSLVDVRIEARALAGSASRRDVTVVRQIALRFIPRAAQRARVFLSAACFAGATGCTTRAPDECTQADLCTEQGMTCGDDGGCTAPIEDRSDAGDVSLNVDVPTGARDSATDVSGDASCIPNCRLRACGSDDCGGNCGTCAAGQSCNASMQCVAACGERDQPCCPEMRCSAPSTTCVDGTCRYCGSHGAPCCGGTSCPVVGFTCQGGRCAMCPTGTRECDNTCVDVSTDVRHCGTCNNACPVGAMCRAGACQSCGAVSQACCSVADGGTVGSCATGATCFSSAITPSPGCTQCGAPGQYCCNGSDCNMGATCRPPNPMGVPSPAMCIVMASNVPGGPCSVAADGGVDSCPTGTYCETGRCRVCGGFNELCCRRGGTTMCQRGLRCVPVSVFMACTP